jgi:RNA polymerase sigma factor (sigma-70 family)
VCGDLAPQAHTTEPAATVDPADVRRIGHDPEALERFYRALVKEMIAYLSRRVPDPHDVADLVAETFLQAMSAARRYDPDRGRPGAWLTGIARNVYLMHVRGKAAESAALQRVQGRRLLDEEDIAQLERQIDAQRAAAGLLGQLDRLTAGEREMIELVDLSGLTPSEAAHALRVPVGLARIRLHRARKRLRAIHERLEDRDGEVS